MRDLRAGGQTLLEKVTQHYAMGLPEGGVVGEGGFVSIRPALVGGWDFGSGSSREEAATALKHRGLQMVIAGSFSQRFERDAFKNGHIVVECPDLVTLVRARFGARNGPTVRPDVEVVVDFARSEVRFDGRGFPFSPLGEVAQRLVVAGGFEAMLREEISSGGQ